MASLIVIGMGIQYWVQANSNMAFSAIKIVTNLLICVCWLCLKRYPCFHPLYFVTFYLVFQELWVNIVIRDVFKDFIQLDTSDTFNLIDQHVVLLVVSILCFWDIKYTLFVISPIWLVGDYLFLTAQN